MADSLTEVLLSPCQRADGCFTRQCSYASRLNYSTGKPSSIGSVQETMGIYFVPSDFVDALPNNQETANGGETLVWDQAAVCDDGSRQESNVGKSLYNMAHWMAGTRPQTTQGDRVAGKGLDVKIRSYNQYGKSFTFRHVGFVRGNEAEGDYHQDTDTVLRAEFRTDGWRDTATKYAVYADVEAQTCAGRTTACLGVGEWTDNGASSLGFVFRRYVYGPEDDVYQVRFGCADEGDTAMMQELLHTFGLTPASGNEVSSTHRYHTWLGSDVLYWAAYSTFSGFRINGAAAAGGSTLWDAGADTYTTRFLGSFGGYRVNLTAGSLARCPNAPATA